MEIQVTCKHRGDDALGLFDIQALALLVLSEEEMPEIDYGAPMTVGFTYPGASWENSSSWVRILATPLDLRPTLLWNSATAFWVALP